MIKKADVILALALIVIGLVVMSWFFLVRRREANWSLPEAGRSSGPIPSEDRHDRGETGFSHK